MRQRVAQHVGRANLERGVRFTEFPNGAELTNGIPSENMLAIDWVQLAGSDSTLREVARAGTRRRSLA